MFNEPYIIRLRFASSSIQFHCIFHRRCICLVVCLSLYLCVCVQPSIRVLGRGLPMLSIRFALHYLDRSIENDDETKCRVGLSRHCLTIIYGFLKSFALFNDDKSSSPINIYWRTISVSILCKFWFVSFFLLSLFHLFLFS